MAEIWKDISGYEGVYQISDMGGVRSLDRIVDSNPPRRFKSKVFIPSVRRGRHVVRLSKEGKQTQKDIAALVLSAFRGPRPAKHCACHKTADKTDCRLTNLRWATLKSHRLHQEINGTLVPSKVMRSDGVEYFSIAIAARAMGIHKSGIQACCAGRQQTAAGYCWEYSESDIAWLQVSVCGGAANG